MVNVLAKKAVLANLTISQWGARRFDHQATDEVLTKHKAKKDTGLFTKRLVPKEAMAAINRAIDQARIYHQQHTQPWIDQGPRVLPTTLYFDYSKCMGELKDKFFQAIAEFVDAYPRYVKEAETELGSLFLAEDYPAANQIRSKFAFDITLMPCPDSQDFRCELDPENIDDIKADLDRRMQDQLQVVMADTGNRIVAVVGKLAERLKAYKPADKAVKGSKSEGRFHDSLIEHVRDLATLLPAFNISEDPKLAKLISRISTDLGTFEASDLRTDDKLRKRVAASADQILKDVSTFLS